MGVLTTHYAPNRVGYVNICIDVKANPHIGPSFEGVAVGLSVNRYITSD